MKYGLVLLLSLPILASAECSPLLQYQHSRLGSGEVVDFCREFTGKVILAVNTASRCGYTPQFAELEALYQRYRSQGLVIVGFPSNDFRQEYADAEKTAKLCYVNYGVSFTMLESSAVAGADANAFFRSLVHSGAQQPSWNFSKYLIDRRGNYVAEFAAGIRPGSAVVAEAIEALLPARP